MKTKPRPSNLLPWLVTVTDLQRYSGRALKECRAGRVILFFYHDRRTRKGGLLALSVYTCWRDLTERAFASLAAGRVKVVRLADAPPVRRGVPNASLAREQRGTQN